MIKISAIETVEDLKEHVLLVTRGVRDAEPKKGPETEIGRMLLSVWEKADFGCQAVHVGEILHIIVKAVGGEDLAFDSSDPESPYPKFSAIVPLEKAGSHDYDIGSPVIVSDVKEQYAVKKTGATGNHLHGKWRYATDDEIEMFFKGFTKKALARAEQNF